ncbi:NAD-dependent epimerase/dehydratase family protein [Mycobacterium sp. SM1]|uniref:NAD-dependent epimerase/dehydratase family protein n=1 Tax=Mycobacterium sp. SM1 TaxID=2816243 RepID=UPI001BD13547|nr:NAD-dependent epimerase/dehydratase family protein [Mycobacterium sp. SM1]MBS4730478.1 NAD-dependent epimerase/dehydratase family protein [Mycobacterium sp. SM1]
MRVAVTGASGVIGRGLVARLLSQGHEVVGLARHRPDSWPGTVEFVQCDIRDAAEVRRAIAGAEVVAHCAWAGRGGAAERTGHEVNIGGTANVLAAMAATGARRIVFRSAAHVYAAHPPATRPRTERDETMPASPYARVEQLLAASGAEWVAVRCGLILGRDSPNWVRRLLASPVFPDVGGTADRPVQVVHPDDVWRVLRRAILEHGLPSGPVNLAAPGELTLRGIATTVGRALIPLGAPLIGPLRRFGVIAELAALSSTPVMDCSRLHQQWRFTPAWNAAECAEDFALAVRGQVSLGKRVVSLPWRLRRVPDVPAVDAPAADGVPPRFAGPDGLNGEFDTPIDPRFPTFLATNLSEALPGPFTPSSASVTVRGLRAAGVLTAERLRPGGLIQREIAMRMVAVFAHRLYGAITSAHFMAATVPFVKPATIVANSGFFGPSAATLPVFGDQRVPSRSGRAATSLRTIRNIGVFGVNLTGLTAGAARDTRDYIADVDRLEQLAGVEVSTLSRDRLLSLILLARDHVVHGWVLAAGSFLVCAAFNAMLRGVWGRAAAPPAGPQLVSARPLDAVHRLAEAARRDPAVARLLTDPGEHLNESLAAQAPEFHAALHAELAVIGHRGPAEVEMAATTYVDDPELLLQMVAKSLDVPAAPAPKHPVIPLRAKAIALLAASQLREREVRRDKMVRAIWVLRRLLREYGRRLTDSGVFNTVDDVFYLLVDELEALPPDVLDLVARRRAEQRRLASVAPPPVFSGSWQPGSTLATVLAVGDSLRGLGVCGGRIRGRVRIVRPETIAELEPGEVLVAEVTDVGYTAAFSYAAAVVTELGGPMSHAAVVAREFGFPCVVDAAGATRRLPPGALVEVDGGAGEIRVLQLAPADNPSPADAERHRSTRN